MARFSGTLGFAQTVETTPGVWEDVVQERSYKGDVLQNFKRFEQGNDAHDGVRLTNQISILADPYAFENMNALRYVKLNGLYWEIQSIEINRPRIDLMLGGVYNGPKA